MKFLIPLLLSLSLWSGPACAGETPAPEAPDAAAPETAAPSAPATETAASAAEVAPAEAAPAVDTVSTEKAEGGIPSWLQYLLALLSTAVTAFLVPFLKRKAQAAKAEAERQSAATTESNINARGILMSRLKQFLYGTASAVAEKKFPELAAKVKSGQLKSSADIKTELRSWGGTLRSDAMAYFGNQGIDVIAAVGDDFLDKLIERAANKVSPFPGLPTAKTLLQENVSDWLIEHGVHWVRQKYLNVNGHVTTDAA